VWVSEFTTKATKINMATSRIRRLAKKKKRASGFGGGGGAC
jgi:hypothetical protein